MLLYSSENETPLLPVTWQRRLSTAVGLSNLALVITLAVTILVQQQQGGETDLVTQHPAILLGFLLPGLSILTTIVGNDNPFGPGALKELKKDWKEGPLGDDWTNLKRSSITTESSFLRFLWLNRIGRLILGASFCGSPIDPFGIVDTESVWNRLLRFDFGLQVLLVLIPLETCVIE